MTNILKNDKSIFHTEIFFCSLGVRGKGVKTLYIPHLKNIKEKNKQKIVYVLLGDGKDPLCLFPVIDISS